MRIPVAVLCVFFAVGCGDRRAAQRPAAAVSSTPTPKPGDPEEQIRHLLDRACDVLNKGTLTRTDHVNFQAIAKELAEATWANFAAITAALRMAREYREDPRRFDLIEGALLQKPDSGGFRLETQNGRQVKRHAKEVYFLDSNASNALAQRMLEEKDSSLQRLELIVLRTHSWSLEWNETPHLGSSTLGDLLRMWDHLGSGGGRSGLSAKNLLLATVGPYQTSDDKVRSFLEAIIRDAALEPALRSTALAEYGRGDVNPARLAMAESLFRNEKNAQVRLSAIGLVTTWFPGSVDSPLKAKSFEILEKVARDDPEGEVRSLAVKAVLEFEDPRALSAVASILANEKDAAVRASILKGFRWATSFYERREHVHGAQDLTARVFQNDPDEEVQRAAVGAYLDLVWRTLWVQDESGTSLDPRALQSIERMVASIQKKPLSPETKRIIKKKLEEEFEKKIPELVGIGEYSDLKRFLDK